MKKRPRKQPPDSHSVQRWRLDSTLPSHWCRVRLKRPEAQLVKQRERPARPEVVELRPVGRQLPVDWVDPQPEADLRPVPEIQEEPAVGRLDVAVHRSQSAQRK